jgi:predicted nucleic acid-binding protein
MINNQQRVLLDTSIWIDAFRGKTPQILTITRTLLNQDRVLTCGPVIFEINRGFRPQERTKILPLFDALTRLSFEEAIWGSAGDLDAALRQKGITIPPMDVLIAQVSLHYKVPLFSLDEHFHSIPKLKLFDANSV